MKQQYKLRVPLAVAELIRHLHPRIKRKLRAGLDAIVQNPQAGKALKEELAGLWSFRIGRYRVIYRLGPRGRIEIVGFGPRERIYEETYRLIGRERRG